MDSELKLSVLMTVYNESDFVEYAISSVLPYVDDLVIVEGAYKESVECGASPRSDDGTIEAIHNLFGLDSSERLDYINGPSTEGCNVYYIEANEKTDKDQRNIGLKKIKEFNQNGWLLIVDGDEVYTKENFTMVRNFMRTMSAQNKMAAYFKSLTFVNDANTCCEQEFPRLFRVTPGCEFVNDNFMCWKDKGLSWTQPHVIKLPYLRYHHYAFCKSDKKRFKLKKDWWESRFKDRDFEYDWYLDEDGKIWSPNHNLRPYHNDHPEAIKDHPLVAGRFTSGREVKTKEEEETKGEISDLASFHESAVKEKENA